MAWRQDLHLGASTDANRPTAQDGTASADNLADEGEPHVPISADIAFMAAFGISETVLKACDARAKVMGVSASDVLMKSGTVTDIEYARCLAMSLGLPFERDTPVFGEAFHTPPDPVSLANFSTMVAVPRKPREMAGVPCVNTKTPLAPDAKPPNEVKFASDLRNPNFHLAPNGRFLPEIARWLGRWPDKAARLSITTSRMNRIALINRASKALTNTACNALVNRSTALSARLVVTPWQAVSLFVLAQLLIVSWVFASGTTANAVHLIATGFYLGCVGLRLWAAMSHKRLKSKPLRHRPDHELPVYSVLVPLYDEASQIDPLARALDALNWPKERLEIKLICEADDQATLEAAYKESSARGRTHFEVVAVPPSLPRTKPKALNYALQVCIGRLITVYDAEDRPHPNQLREAHNAFLTNDRRVAVLQAPLVVVNGERSWFARMFAIEYSALFDGLLPALDRAGSFGPLGGTSNHFKRAALDHIGAWDPHNVTEDADLGIRMARAGLHFATLELPTYETAPQTASVWFGQRTRWFKGWMQTWLVHMRQPFRLWRQLGIKQYLVFHLMITGMIVSALIHPLLWLGVAYYGTQLLHLGHVSLTLSGLFYLDLASILLGYATMAALAMRTLPQRDLQALATSLIGLPIYWLCLSAAAWRALHELIRRPHHWEKTQHNDFLGS